MLLHVRTLRTLLQALFLCWLLLASQAWAGKLPLWELEGGSNRILMLGSIHYLRPSDYPLPAAFDEALDAADLVVMELDMDSLDPLSSMMVLETLGREPGKTLKDQIGASRYNEVSSRAGSVGIDMRLLDDKKAWYAAVLVSQVRLLQMGFDPSWGIEARFTAGAVAAGKPIIGLETLEGQLGTMDRMSVDTQADFLIESLNDQEAAEEEMQTIVRAWKSGETGEMESVMLEGFDEMPELYQSLLVSRNRSWVSQLKSLDKRHSNKTILIIVGGMHLVGKDSVQSMLKPYGYSSKQLSE